MGTPTNQSEPAVSFSVDAMINRIHRRYTRTIVELVNENAQLAATNDALKQRLAEVENENTALRDNDSADDILAELAQAERDAEAVRAMVDSGVDPATAVELVSLGCTVACAEGHTNQDGCAMQPQPAR